MNELDTPYKEMIKKFGRAWLRRPEDMVVPEYITEAILDLMKAAAEQQRKETQ